MRLTASIIVITLSLWDCSPVQNRYVFAVRQLLTCLPWKWKIKYNQSVREISEEGSFMAKAVVDKDVCVGCEACVGVCPVEAISMIDGKAEVEPDKCIECGSCVPVCPVEAITQD